MQTYKKYQLGDRNESRQIIYDLAEEVLSGKDPMVQSPMPGRITAVWVKVGDSVKRGQPLAVIEAMKMENEVVATRDGYVEKVMAETGQTVKGKQPLFELRL